MSTESKLAVVFPGQGSQSLGMMNGLIEIKPELKEVFATASELLSYDLLDVITSGPEEKLNQTEVTQPALLATSYATWLILKEHLKLKPTVFAGHSLGEYTALVCANVISFEDAITLVAERGRCMQRAVPEGVGAMAAILGLENEQVTQACTDAAQGEIVSAANFNSPGQIVIAGNNNAVVRAIDSAKEMGAKRAILLPVSVPSHCMLMKDAAVEFETALNKVSLHDAEIPVLQNVDAKPKSSSDEIRSALLEQLYMPVRWVDSVNNIKDSGVIKVIECGPGKVLSGLIKRIDRSFEIFSIQDRASLEKAVSS
ncbi:MAG: ACP S-malonyltransferase [Proteobacteria bacterium]|nr:[acyl-carrier-protein] S-malonyltransferase [Pseudomonadota bacterium]NOG59387.1 ACP S-malonyltransferase [Pseudomonadota bacterium]